MNPTNKLRFVEREETIDGFSIDDIPVIRSVRVLQQWWINKHSPVDGEWRDVPLEVNT